MKKYVIFLGIATLCAILSFFQPMFNIGVIIGFTVVTFLFGKSISKKEPKSEMVPHLIQYDEAQRADAPMLGAAGIICALAVAGVALKTIFYVWDKISGKQEFSLENFHLIIITVVLVSLPTVIGFHWRKIQSYQFQLRID